MSMYFTGQKKRRSVNMSHFRHTAEFDREFKRLLKKYPSLKGDLKTLEQILEASPTGFGTNFVIVHSSSDVQVIKTRLACRSLRKRSMRVVYAFHHDVVEFVYIEIYFKGDKENEDRKRIETYLEEGILEV